MRCHNKPRVRGAQQLTRSGRAVPCQRRYALLALACANESEPEALRVGDSTRFPWGNFSTGAAPTHRGAARRPREAHKKPCRPVEHLPRGNDAENRLRARRRLPEALGSGRLFRDRECGTPLEGAGSPGGKIALCRRAGGGYWDYRHREVRLADVREE